MKHSAQSWQSPQLHLVSHGWKCDGHQSSHPRAVLTMSMSSSLCALLLEQLHFHGPVVTGAMVNMGARRNGFRAMRPPRSVSVRPLAGARRTTQPRKRPCSERKLTDEEKLETVCVGETYSSLYSCRN